MASIGGFRFGHVLADLTAYVKYIRDYMRCIRDHCLTEKRYTINKLNATLNMSVVKEGITSVS